MDSDEYHTEKNPTKTLQQLTLSILGMRGTLSCSEQYKATPVFADFTKLLSEIVCYCYVSLHFSCTYRECVCSRRLSEFLTKILVMHVIILQNLSDV